MLNGIFRSTGHCNKFEAEVPPTGKPIFEGLERVGAVSVEVAVVAVVQAEHVAVGGGFGLGVISDGLNAFNQPVRRLGAPVAWEQGPEDGAHAELLSDLADPRTAEAIRWTEPARSGLGDAGDGFVAAGELIAGFDGAGKEKIRVSVGVISDEVAAGGDFAG